MVEELDLEWRRQDLEDGIGDFLRMYSANTLLQYNFRVNALAGDLPGVKKASW